MIQIPSPSGDEAALAAYLAERMDRLGFDVSLDPSGNVVGQTGPSDGIAIMLLGHLDTVPGQLAVRRDGSLLFGRGAVDAKGPLATLVAAAASASTEARLIVVGAVEEELPSSRGARALIDSSRMPAAVVIGEPGGWCGVSIGYKGRVDVIFDVRRRPTHTSSPEEKAVEVAAAFWHRLHDALGADTAGGSNFERTTATLTEFHGDIANARARVVCRLPVGADVATLERLLCSIGADGMVTLDGLTPAVRRDRRDPVVRALTRAIREHGGRPRLKLKSGTSDMNIVASAWDVPIAAFGPGDSSLDHTDDEHLDVAEYVRAIAILARALEHLPGLLAESATAAAGAVTCAAGEEASVSERLRAPGYAR